MRPVRLELKGFTAYRQAQVIEFEDLDLFAITGPTGSGKSSLLDAMTYALYGRVERVGHKSTLLISQGQPSLSVMLEFDVDGGRYRVTRTTGHKARQSTIRLERSVEGSWRSFGDGADRIKDATRLIIGLIGLDYPAFTRSVLLPQGKFSEFLTGDRDERRDILTELLDLGLYERMSRRAGEVARSAKAAGEANAKVVASQFAGVDRGALKEAARVERDARARSAAMDEAVETVAGLEKRWGQERARIETLSQLADEAAEVQEAAEDIAGGLERIAHGVREARAMAARARTASQGASEVSDAALRDLAEGEHRLGTPADLARAGAGLDELGRAEAWMAEAQAEAAKAAERVGPSRTALDSARDALSAAEAGQAGAAAARTAADEAAETARHVDLVATVSSGLGVGDPCPVCGHALQSLPRPARGALARADRARDRARREWDRASTARAAAERDAAVAEAAVAGAEQEAARALAELERWRGERESVLSRVAAAFGGVLPLDPMGELRERNEQIRRLRAAAEEAAAAAREAELAAAGAAEAARGAAEQGVSLVERLRALPLPRLMERSRRAVPSLDVPPAVSEAVPADPREASTTARGWAKACAEVAGALRSDADDARSSLGALLDQARRSLPAGIPEAVVTDVEELLAAVRTLATDLVAETAAAARDAERMRERLAQRTALETEIRDQAARAAVYGDLATELRADQLISFLQGEALELLAAAGSERLLALSQGRYRLAFQDDEFFVEDRENGDERRSVRTLSGGETFLASLALALALSEQIRSLAVTHRARLESLFIDEGFGALDPESLDIATEALSHLGGQDRLVGVITHVAELAERLPVRIEVEKEPAGSRLRVVW